ncbi:von Willebrand factor D and EGF domain-containing protein-like [Engraulis encrasicolus]|uniref:von Willebrand factor D and EGF domain-containing protein-like n=1 Tax=Engraulis encrasicolus TaxID=184585 RepID=UPI002FCE6F3A
MEVIWRYSCLSIIEYLFILCFMPLDLFAQLAPECYPNRYRTLRNPYRSVDFDSTELQNTAIQDLICDHSLPAGWYRFTINNKPAEMPTSCVEMNRCGTQAPVWLSLKDSSLPQPGEVRQLSACATWQFFHGSTKDCCLFRIPISVRNCGDFLLYFLQPTQGCMGYCAKVTIESPPRSCPPGQVEVNGVCKAIVPQLSSPPVVAPELLGSSVHLRCSFPGVASSLSSLPVGYLVVWLRLSAASGTKEEVRRDSTLKPFSLVEMDGVHFRLGETFSCSVSTFLRNSSKTQSLPKESDGFFAGIKFFPESLHIREDGREHQVSVFSTVPISCHGAGQPGPTQQCKVTLGMSVHDQDSRVQEAPNVALSSCQLELMPTAATTTGAACGPEGCAQGTLLLTATTDFTRDGNRASLVTPQPTRSTPRLWRSYRPDPLKVTVQDVPTATCYSLTDPHVITFDGRRYDNHQTGTFVLYRSLSREFEVQARHWDCGSRHYAVACSCGVAVREGNDLVTFDMCNGQLQETRPHLSVKSLSKTTPPQVKIHESHQGRKVTILFRSGAFVRADVSDWGMSLALRAPGSDLNRTRGLCGTFDRNGNNDLHRPDGAAITSGDLQHFINSWRIAAGESLFDSTPPPALAGEIKSHFCRCQRGYGTPLHGMSAANFLFNQVPTSSSACQEHDSADYTSLFPFRDTTAEHTHTLTHGYETQGGHEHEQSVLKRHTVSPAESQHHQDGVAWASMGRKKRDMSQSALIKPSTFSQTSVVTSGENGPPSNQMVSSLPVPGSEEDSSRPNDRRAKRQSLYDFPPNADHRNRHHHPGPGSSSPQQQHPDTDFQPVLAFQSLSQADLENFAYFFPDDHLSESRPVPQPVWPTPSGLTSAKALELCQTALSNSTVGRACRTLLDRRLDEAVELCIQDLQLKDDLAWEDALLPFLENECERRLLRNRTLRALQLGGGGGGGNDGAGNGNAGDAAPGGVGGGAGVSGDIVTALRCPNMCTGNGLCTEAGCQCYPGHSFYDCSIPISQMVELTDLENSGLCDFRAYDCSSIRVFGLGFLDSPNLSCHATKLMYVNGEWIPGEKTQTRATFLSSKAVDCDVPALSAMAEDSIDFTMDDRPYARWKIQVTNDGSQYSEPKVLTLYDGVCQQCSPSASGLCKLKEKTCNIEGMCFREGDANPTSPCLLCNPTASKFTWSLNEVNQPPTFHEPSSDLRSFVGENFVYQLTASDPEGSALLFLLEAGPPPPQTPQGGPSSAQDQAQTQGQNLGQQQQQEQATLSPAGLLIWKVHSEETQTFGFTVSDECNAQSRHSVQVTVRPCGCVNGGTCVTDINFPPGSGAYLCVCAAGFRGERCEEREDACASQPCGGGGTCLNTGDGFRCQCTPGLTGAMCEEDVDECDRSLCYPGVRCLNTYGSFTCASCPAGYTGDGLTCTAVVPVFTPAPSTSGQTGGSISGGTSPFSRSGNAIRTSSSSSRTSTFSRTGLQNIPTSGSGRTSPFSRSGETSRAIDSSSRTSPFNRNSGTGDISRTALSSRTTSSSQARTVDQVRPDSSVTDGKTSTLSRTIPQSSRTGDEARTSPQSGRTGEEGRTSGISNRISSSSSTSGPVPVLTGPPAPVPVPVPEPAPGPAPDALVKPSGPKTPNGGKSSVTVIAASESNKAARLRASGGCVRGRGEEEEERGEMRMETG